eukprot:1659779-Alexandrium_andersonii.AAC.1
MHLKHSARIPQSRPVPRTPPNFHHPPLTSSPTPRAPQDLTLAEYEEIAKQVGQMRVKKRPAADAASSSNVLCREVVDGKTYVVALRKDRQMLVWLYEALDGGKRVAICMVPTATMRSQPAPSSDPPLPMLTCDQPSICPPPSHSHLRIRIHDHLRQDQCSNWGLGLDWRVMGLCSLVEGRWGFACGGAWVACSW